MLTWRIPRIARFVFFLMRGDVMAACTCVRVRQEGVIPCRMVPSVWDEVHGSCMTHGRGPAGTADSCRAKVRELRVAVLDAHVNLKLN